jgi:hypothetical protein
MAEDSKTKAPGSQARHVATQRLIENHRDEFETLYEEEAKKRNVKTQKMKNKERADKLRAELAKLEGTTTDDGDVSAWPAHDLQPCIEDGEHLSTQRHPIEECPTMGDDDPDRTKDLSGELVKP